MEKKEIKNVENIAFDSENDRVLFVCTSNNKPAKGKLSSASLTKPGLMSVEDKKKLSKMQVVGNKVYKLGSTSGWNVLTLHLTFQYNNSQASFNSFFLTAYAMATNDKILSYTVPIAKKGGQLTGINLFCENIDGQVSVYLQGNSSSIFFNYTKLIGIGYLEEVSKDMTGLQEIEIP